MAFAYKPKGRNKWLAKFRDPASPTGWRVRSGYVDEEATIKLAHRLEIEAARRYEGIHVPESDQDRKRRSLATLRGEFTAYLRHKGDTAKHVRSTDQRIRDVAAGCGWASVRDLDAADALKWLAGQRDLAQQGERPGGPEYRKLFGVWTTNHYLRALKSFGRWLVMRRVIVASPFAGVPLMKEEPGRARPRRVITAAEFGRLLESTRASAEMFRGMTGADRADVYLTAALTGLRAGEISRLTSADVDLDRGQIRVPATSDKARRESWLPIHAELRPVLLRQVKVPSKSLANALVIFPGTWHEKAATMLRFDLAAAKIPYETTAGRFDFHALRSFYITSLALAGVHPIAAQKLARHSTPALTSAVYTKLGIADLAAELGKVQLASALTRKRRTDRNKGK